MEDILTLNQVAELLPYLDLYEHEDRLYFVKDHANGNRTWFRWSKKRCTWVVTDDVPNAVINKRG